jgi:hypothetical protein
MGAVTNQLWRWSKDKRVYPSAVPFTSGVQRIATSIPLPLRDPRNGRTVAYKPCTYHSQGARAPPLMFTRYLYERARRRPRGIA